MQKGTKFEESTWGGKNYLIEIKKNNKNQKLKYCWIGIKVPFLVCSFKKGEKRWCRIHGASMQIPKLGKVVLEVAEKNYKKAYPK